VIAWLILPMKIAGVATVTTQTIATSDRIEKAQPGWVKLLDMSDRALAVLLLTPAAVLLTLIIVYPVLRLGYTSFFSLSLTSGLPAEFVGFENYQLMFTDPVFWETTWNTVLITLITVPGALIVGMALALLANLPFGVQWPVRLSFRGRCHFPSPA